MVTTLFRHSSGSTLVALLLVLVSPSLSLADEQVPPEAASAEGAVVAATENAPEPERPVAPPVVLAEGEPPLTDVMVSHFGNFLEWTLDATLTQQQRLEVRQSLLAAWQDKDAETITSTGDIVSLMEQLPTLSEADRKLLRESLSHELLSGARAAPQDPGNQWLLGIYDAAHVPLAQGNPPLTRQVTDALVEMVVFMVAEATGTEGLAATPEMRDEFAADLAAQWPALAPEEQAEASKLPIQWAALRVVWPTLDEEQKTQLRASWAEQFKLSAPQEPAQDEQAEAPADTANDSATRMEDLMKQQALLEAQRQSFQVMSNVLKMSANTSTIISNNIAGNSWEWRY
ncbi:MAG: hypothetical protein HPY44_09450 [Armatimonadetes bacterium]|nr:hypothetical protein [Armatimonadota bacterium]